MSDERIHYIVVPRTALAARVAQADDKQLTFSNALVAFKNEIGAQEIIVRDRSRFAGATFPDNAVPLGWRTQRGKDYCVPNLSTREGKAIRLRTEALPNGVGSYFLHELCAWSNNKVYFVGLSRLCGKVVISVHHSVVPPPSDAKPMKNSEYWTLREKHEKREEDKKRGYKEKK